MQELQAVSRERAAASRTLIDQERSVLRAHIEWAKQPGKPLVFRPLSKTYEAYASPAWIERRGEGKQT